MEKKVEELLDLIRNDAVLTEGFKTAQNKGLHLNISGLCDEQKGFVAAGLARTALFKPVVIVPDAARARRAGNALAAFVDGSIVTLMPSEMSLVTAEAASRDLELSRCVALSKIITGDYAAAVIPAGSLLNKLNSPSEFRKRILGIRIGDSIEREKLVSHLVQNGYERTAQVTQAGEFACRGDIADIFVPGEVQPYRISFFDDEVDQIKSFDYETQRSTEQLTEVTIVPACVYYFDEADRAALKDRILGRCREDISRMNPESHDARKAAQLLERTAQSDAQKVADGVQPEGLSRWIGITIDNPASVLEYFEAGSAMFFADEMIEIDSRLNAYASEYAQRCRESFEIGMAPTCAPGAMFNLSRTLAGLDSLTPVHTLAGFRSDGNGLPGGIDVTVSGAPAESFVGRTQDLAELIKRDRRRAGELGKASVYLMVSGSKRMETVRQRLAEADLYTDIIDAPLSAGFSYPKLGIELIGEQELFGNEHISKPKKKGGNRITVAEDVKPGDYVVHDSYGIGRYEGLINMKVGDTRKDYLKISYAKEEILYILPEDIDSLQKYIGPGDREPKLSRLGGDEWKKSVSRAKESIKKVAFDLLKLYAQRSVNAGFACLPDDENQKQFEERFPFVETEDQLRAIKEIKADMESEQPMDRLLCGDVGFGKTEVAFRAMFKAVMNGTQAIMLAPTTLLAQQHYQNFVERCKGFPVNVVLLSRFVNPSQIKANLIDIKNGKADVIIGTHRVLSNDVRPPHLGLLVVDEEQRFGVNHKEKIKSMKSNVDVLTLTATPIPRTLHMSLSGIRDISILEEAPFNRRAVQTYVMGYDEQIVVQACMREISRGGQVFYLYNRTSNIDKVSERLSRLMPGMRIIYAHGQMAEHELETIVEDFIAGAYDILVCTTIIENGVDISNVNTLIVENADKFGLAQLYQIKGRVGRSDRQAYAYITYDESCALSEEARKRLAALREFTELGSGVRIAIRDLEVRGAGSLLGAEQHGQMDVIGYELYCRLLDEEIREQKLLSQGGEGPDHADAAEGLSMLSQNGTEFVVDVDYDSYIPAAYIPDESARMAAYRRIGAIGSLEDYSDFQDEMTDRYGDAPAEVLILSGISLIRTMGPKIGFVKASIRSAGVRLYLNPRLQIDLKALGALMNDPLYGARCHINATGSEPYMSFKPTSMSQSKTIDEIVGLLKIMTANKSSETVA